MTDKETKELSAYQVFEADLLRTILRRLDITDEQLNAGVPPNYSSARTAGLGWLDPPLIAMVKSGKSCSYEQRTRRD
jgi:hypothetical protein